MRTWQTDRNGFGVSLTGRTVWVRLFRTVVTIN